MIIRRGKNKADYFMDSNDHAPLLKKFKLKDKKIIDRDFVRIELHPKDSLTSKNIEDWDFVIDEIRTMPEWFDQRRYYWANHCLEVMTTQIVPEWIKNGISGALYLQDTQVKTLGQLKSVGGFLYLQGTQVKTLPKTLKVKGNIYK